MVAAAGRIHPLGSLGFGAGVGSGTKVTTTTLKRKTPSELRGEQLKRKNIKELVDESPDSVIGYARNNDWVIPGSKNADLQKNPRYINTRMNELYPVRKNSNKLRLLSKKDDSKDCIPTKNSGSQEISSVSSEFAAQSQLQIPREQAAQTFSTADKCNGSTFRSVAELSLGNEKLSGLPTVDIDKALKGLVAHEPIVASNSCSEPSKNIDGHGAKNLCSEFHVPCKKTPLDLTLKTTMRIVSSTSVNWFHRLVSCGSINSLSQYAPSVCSSRNMTSSEVNSTNQVLNPLVLHSWVYPQSPLPPSVISALTLSASQEGQMDFLSKRQQAWEDSFRSLYYMLRKNKCNIFYVCTAQFVVMFTGAGSLKENKCVCNAFISQSTRGLRSLLKEHDVCFSMPLCDSKVEEVSKEDLFELSEIEKQNLGKTTRPDTLAYVDNSPQSLLAFMGNENVHGLYDFLLNYRYFLTSLTGMDVPMLYSPLPFENAALSAPEVRCKEVRRIDHMPLPSKESSGSGESNMGHSQGICYSIEIKDRYLPPWIISNTCYAVCSRGTSFEASFVTEPTSIGLNIGSNVGGESSDLQASANEGLEKGILCFGVPNTTHSSHLQSAFLKELKYDGNTYTAFLSPL
ncbi:protein downstream neighbor of Son [Ipomoea triloba]|uniref:protein downstream neighbor of Son n=1 Tax=Ipomoea triloba TaxID=35885 RepID=UPI00125E1C9D|nr:protein downstream neighbor of Son [Ipomoea triloba]XP_031129128.1 protein downstream neighbor of Son [Ipomoea triloba]